MADLTEQVAALAARLDALEAENTALREELAVERSARATDPPSLEVVGSAAVSRRQLLGRLGGLAAAATAGAVVTAQAPAAAGDHAGQALELGEDNVADDKPTAILSSNPDYTLAAANFSGGAGLVGVSGQPLDPITDYVPAAAPAVMGVGNVNDQAVFLAIAQGGGQPIGFATDLNAVENSRGGRFKGSVAGAEGWSTAGIGLYGRAGAAGGVNIGPQLAGVKGDGADGAVGVLGTSTASLGVYGVSSTNSGVRGSSNGSGAGVLGTSGAGPSLRAGTPGGGFGGRL
jgi:hypothetical protein